MGNPWPHLLRRSPHSGGDLMENWPGMYVVPFETTGVTETAKQAHGHLSFNFFLNACHLT